MAAELETNKEPPTLLATRVGLLATRVVASSELPRKRKESNRSICPHCDQALSNKTFKKHKRLYSKNDGSWISVGPCDSVEQETSDGKGFILSHQD